MRLDSGVLDNVWMLEMYSSNNTLRPEIGVILLSRFPSSHTLARYLISSTHILILIPYTFVFHVAGGSDHDVALGELLTLLRSAEHHTLEGCLFGCCHSGFLGLSRTASTPQIDAVYRYGNDN